MKLSGWFDGAKFVPGSPGVYERNLPGIGRSVFAWWNGNVWLYNNFRTIDAREYHGESAYQNLLFRGVLK